MVPHALLLQFDERGRTRTETFVFDRLVVSFDYEPSTDTRVGKHVPLAPEQAQRVLSQLPSVAAFIATVNDGDSMYVQF